MTEAESAGRFDWIEPPEIFTDVRCVNCGDTVSSSETVTIGEDIVCEDCISDYCDKKYQHLGADYLEENEREYLESSGRADSDELFYNWWFSSVDKPDRLRILKAAYLAEKQNGSPLYEAEAERDFCTQAGSWPEFVTEKVC